jgi:hypothetical protein
MIQDKQQLVLVSHGLLNLYLKKYLRRQGWEVEKRHGVRYLGSWVLTKPHLEWAPEVVPVVE